jgi:translation initiation factor IF-1
MGQRNVDGGKNAKRQGRKYQVNASTSLRKAVDDLELYAVVTKMCGGNLCKVMTQNGNELCCHMGGKFRGRNKRQNFVENGKWVLVGLRNWEKTAENCDLEYVYDRTR